MPKPLGIRSAGPRRPIITEHPESVVSQGSAQRLYCKADGDPEPKLSWLRNGVPLTHFIRK